MLKKVLITGVSGFAGSHLAEYLLKQKKYFIYGTYLTEESLRLIENIKNKINLEKADLSEKETIFKIIEKIKPDYIYHLAALTSPTDSFKKPEETIINNILVQLYLLEAIRDQQLLNSRILITSSADIYGIISKEDLPISEEVKIIPTSPYSVSKITQDYLAWQYFLSYKMKIIRVRPFNHIGPRQSPNFVVSAFAKKIAEIEKEKREPIMDVGNLNSKRDFTDVRDVVKAYSLLLERGEFGEVYNIGSGRSYQIAEVLERLISFSTKKIEIKINPELFRPLDIPELRCDYAKLQRQTGWQPVIKIEQTLKETLDYWRSIV